MSIPCFERFDRQSDRVSIEAAVSSSWAKYLGLDGVTIGIDRFGLSAPGAVVMKELGMTVEHVFAEARQLPGG